MADLINQNTKQSHSGAIAGFLGIAVAVGLTAGTIVVATQSGQDTTQGVYRAQQMMLGSPVGPEDITNFGDPFPNLSLPDDLPSNDIYDPLEARFGEFSRLNEITFVVLEGSSVWGSLNQIVVQDGVYDDTLADSERLTGNLVEALGEQNPGLDLDNVQPCDRFSVVIRPSEYSQVESGHYPVPSETTVHPNSVIETGPIVPVCDPYVTGVCVPFEQPFTDEQGLPPYPTQSGTEVPFGMDAPLGSVTEPSTGTPNSTYDSRDHSHNGTAQELPDK
jgi:hypothetical protein